MIQSFKITFTFLFACLLVCACQFAKAQGTAMPAPPASKITVYYANYADEKSRISVDEAKKYGFYQTVTDTTLSDLLFAALSQRDRPELLPTLPVNAHFVVERSDPPAAFAISPSGVVWSGTRCYQLSADDQRTVSDIVRHHIFTPAFWSKNVGVAKAIKFDDITSGIEFNADRLNGKPIIVSFVIDEDGKALNPRIVQSCGNDDLDEAACDAVKHQKFTPVMENGEPKRAYCVHAFVVN